MLPAAGDDDYSRSPITAFVIKGTELMNNGNLQRIVVTVVTLAMLPALVGCRGERSQMSAVATRSTPDVPQSLAMGAAKSRMTFFVTSVGPDRGGNLGGLAGADAYCQTLAMKEFAGDHTWHAYLSTTATLSQPAINARDRIGAGPWYNAEAELVAANLEQLHSKQNRVSKETSLTEKGDPVSDIGGETVEHDVLTGSRPDGTAFSAKDDLSCGNWTSSDQGRAQVGHADIQKGQDAVGASWNSAHASGGCSPGALSRNGRAALLYCFASD
jgi:hypothetical protein